jgi:hypothetical protein
MNEFQKHENEEEANPQNNLCNACKEGLVMGGSVYCSIDGRFHPSNDNLACKSFVARRATARKNT